MNRKWNILTSDKIIVNGKKRAMVNIYLNTKYNKNSENASVRWLGIVSMASCDRRHKDYYEVIEISGKKYGYKTNAQNRVGGGPYIYRDWERQSDAIINLWREAVYTETGLNAEFLEKNGYSVVTDCGYCWNHNDFFSDESFWYPVYKITPRDEVERCEDCNAPLAYEDVVRINPYATDRHVCSSCHDYYRECANCGEVFRPGMYNDFCSEECYEEYQRNHRTSEDVIHRYSYTPDDWTYHAAGPFDDGNRYFGIELEVRQSSSDEDVAWFEKDEDEVLFFQKYDSSISSGTEVVFHPQTRNYFDNSGYDLITELYNNFSYLACGTNSRIGSGMHVHISRTAFNGDEAIRKFCELINIKYVKSLIEFSERTADELEEWAMFHPEYPTCGEIDRYTAVNLRNDDTVEVRIFRTPARPQKVAEIVHLLDNLVDVANGVKQSCAWLDLQEARLARK